MGWGGIIAGAVTGGAQAVQDTANNQIAQNSKMDLMRLQQDLEQEKLRYADELSRNKALWEVDTGPEGYATKRTAADTAREESLQGARTAAAVDQATRMIPVDLQKEETLAPVKAKNALNSAVAVKTAENELDRADTMAKGGDKNYLSALRSMANAKEGSAAQASAAKSVYEMGRLKLVDKIRDEASSLLAAGDKAGAEQKLRMADLAAGKAQSKNFSDVAAFAKVLETQAAALLDPMKGGNPDSPENQAEAKALRLQIRAMSEDVSSSKGLSGTPPPAAASEAQAHADARAAVATGRISAAEANKRLTGAGFKPFDAAPAAAASATSSAAPAQKDPAAEAKLAKQREWDDEAQRRKRANEMSHGTTR